MFLQVQLLRQDQSLLRFLWQNMRELAADVYEWQVLPFGTTSSLLCNLCRLRNVRIISTLTIVRQTALRFQMREAWLT